MKPKIPKALYVVLSSPDNPHAEPIAVFTTKRRADRTLRWGDRRAVTYAPVNRNAARLLEAFEAWWRTPTASVGSFPSPSVLAAAEALYGPPGGPAAEPFVVGPSKVVGARTIVGGREVAMSVKPVPATMAPCEGEHSDDGSGGAS